MGKIEILDEMTRVLDVEARALRVTADRFREQPMSDALVKAIALLQKSLDQGGKILVTGVGKSGKIGEKIVATLCSTGSLAVFLHPTEAFHGDLGMLRSQDVVLALSYTGNTAELLQLVPTIKAMKVPMIGLVGYSQSQFAQACDVWIDASVEEEACPYHLAPTSSTTLALAIGDAIALTLMQLRGFNEGHFAQNHPGGSLGKKLTLTVADLMHSGRDLPQVDPKMTMDQVVIVATDKKLGAVLVMDGSQLLGLITDGDVRRALQHREKFFQLTAEEVMCVQPVTVRAQQLATDALRLMEDRPSQISVLPVVDQHGNCQGLLRLHDLVRAF